MKTKTLFQYVGIVLAVLALSVGPVQGQEPEPLPAEGPGEAEYILAQPPYTMNYQGYLTDSGGSPLNGTYDLAFRLYDADTGGNVEWGPETHDNVQVTNGIFQVTLGSSVALLPDVFDEALFLAVRVNGTLLATRQPLHAVPYAFGLVPGAEVEGDPDGTNYGLSVRNTGAGANDRGLYAQGIDHGVYAYGVNDAGLYATTGSGPYAIHSADATYSGGGYAGPDTYIWIPAHNAVIHSADVGEDVQLLYHAHGLEVDAGPGVSTSTEVSIHIPIQVERPYGRDYHLRYARVYYYVAGDAKLEAAHIHGLDFSDGGWITFGSSSTDGTSPSFDTYDIEATTVTAITDSQAPTNLTLTIDLPNSASSFYLSGVRLQLESDY